MFIVEGLGAAILIAEMEWNEYTNTPHCKVSVPILNWEDATEEQRKQGGWCTNYANSKSPHKYKFRTYTEAEVKELEEYEIKKLKGMYKYILDNYGWSVAQDFYNTPDWNKDFKKYNLKMEDNLPHCKYTEEGQCDLFCSFYKKEGCQWMPESEAAACSE